MPRRHANRKEKSYLAPPDGPWIAFSREMMESLAWRSLSRAGFMMLSRMCIEHAAHGGRENGRLAIGYNDFVAYGIHRSLIPNTLLEITGLGFARCTEPGRRPADGSPGRRACYRLTFVGTIGEPNSGRPTDEWRSVTAENIGHLQAELKTRRSSVSATPRTRTAERAELLQ